MTQQFDLFVANEAVPAKVTGSWALKRHSPNVLCEADMVRQLQETGRYRILKKLEPRSVAVAARSGFPLKGVILDTETTGLNHRKDEIIEIGAIASHSMTAAASAMSPTCMVDCSNRAFQSRRRSRVSPASPTKWWPVR